MLGIIITLILLALAFVVRKIITSDKFDTKLGFYASTANFLSKNNSDVFK